MVAERLQHSNTGTYCPYKGEAAYYTVAAGDDVVEDAIWTYPEPYPAVAAIAGRVAFYPDKAEITVGSAAAHQVAALGIGQVVAPQPVGRMPHERRDQRRRP